MNKSYIPCNGTEGSIFRERFCYQCKHEHKYIETQDPEHACQIFNATLLYNPGDDEYPAEWIYKDPDDIFSGTCTAFEEYIEPDGSRQEPKDTVTMDLFDQIR